MDWWNEFVSSSPLYNSENENEKLQLVDEIASYPTFLPTDYILNTFLPLVLLTAVTLTIIYNVSYAYLIQYILPSPISSITKLDKSKTAYQITNCCFNVIVGCVGLYQHYVVIPKLHHTNDTNTTNDNDTNDDNSLWILTVIGYHVELYHVAAIQLGYQIFVLPICILVIGEKIEMIYHHVAVVISSSTSGLLYIGFRYYIPYFYGIFELSSIPLSIMNHMKLHSETLQKQHPTLFFYSRNIFALSFIVIRVILSPAPKFLRDLFFVMYTMKNNDNGYTTYYLKLYLFIQWCFSFYLQLLQLYWTTLIVKGFLKVLLIGGGGSSKDKKKQK